MRKGLGVCCILLGICCLIASVGFIYYNQWEDAHAQTASQEILRDVQENILDNTLEESVPEETVPVDSTEIPEEVPQEEPQEVRTTQVNDYECIGVLSIPVLELELPVLNEWNYAKLKIAPCQYYGSYYEENFVIAAHNYRAHFGRLSMLQPKDLVLFTDISGNVYYYEVVLLETLSGDATREMITSGFDLTLYTCTPGGASRVTVRCNALSG